MIIVVNGHAIYTSLPQHVVLGGDNRHQTYFSSLEEQVAADNPVRLMDAFVEKLEKRKIAKITRTTKGTPTRTNH